MPTILVSYRRDDSKWITGRIVDRLEQHFGKDNVFMDVDSIPVGMDFREHLRSVLDQCNVLLAVVGPHWLVADSVGRPRILDAADWVRIEIETALIKGIPIVPVLIDQAGMPRADELPGSLQDFAFRQAAFINTGRDFHSHVDRLIRAIGECATRPKSARQDSEAPRQNEARSRPPEFIVVPERPAPKERQAPAPSAPAAAAPAFLAKSVSESSKDEPADVLPLRPALAPSRPRSRAAGRGIGVAIGVALFAGVVSLAYWQLMRGGLFEPGKTANSTADTGNPSGQASPRPKISDRIEPEGQKTPAATPGAAVAQRVVLYDEDPNDPQGKRFVGSAIWRTEKVSPSLGKPPELAVRADVEIPERQIGMTWTLRRNTDPNLPASHTVEIMFKLPKDFAAGGVSSVPGVLMKAGEQTRGVPLAGLAVKVTNSFFLIGLSATEADRDRNLQLLKERAWFDIPVVYNNNRRGIIALEKGAPGERAFAEAFAEWKQ